MCADRKCCIHMHFHSIQWKNVAVFFVQRTVLPLVTKTIEGPLFHFGVFVAF